MAEGKSESSSSSMESLDHLPSALLATIMTNLDVASICSVASTCTAFKACASQILSFIPSFHLLVSLSIFISGFSQKIVKWFVFVCYFLKNGYLLLLGLGNRAFHGFVEASAAS